MGLLDRLRSEYAYLTGALRMLKRVTAISKTPGYTFPDLIQDLAERFGQREALTDGRERLSYRQYNARGNRYARWALAQGIAKGDTVALLMPNRPEYLAIWLGITRAGGVAALLNTNLAGHSLAHCIAVADCNHVIVSDDLLDAYETARPHLKSEPKLWVHGAARAGQAQLDQALEGLSDANLAQEEKPDLSVNDSCLYIYTSGTTGLPKAANISHYRVLAIMHAFSAATKATADDRIYICLPLYHTVGGVLATGTVLTVGGTAIIRERFSSSEFWDDIIRHEVTIFQYIGELCRYLLNGPTHPGESRHKLRLCTGNGLRPDVWEAFKTRFNIPQILEWYASTEGNATLFNLDGKVGAIGRVPSWLKHKFVIEVVKIDIETENPVKGPDGFCVPCGADEPGELISKILNDPSKPGQRFDGYADKEATERKILRGAFEKGDAWFRTGDLVRRDSLGYYYFVDRIGDTFRWKGENVSTAEVSETITVFPGIREANVYGVTVPGHDGRAGMAAIITEDGLDFAGLRAHLHKQLPDYARPLFLRVTHGMDTTGTFKQRKVDLVKQGFDPEQISDELYFDHPETRRYEPLDATIFRSLQEGAIRV